MTLPKPRAVIFDWDNTLVDTWPIIHTALNATLRDMGRPEWTLEQTRGNVSKSMRDSFPLVFGESWRAAADLYQSHYRSSHLQRLTPLPLASEVLEGVRRMNIPCVVVSNKRGPNLRQEVTHLEWDHYFGKIVGADDAANDKPHVDPVNLAFEKTDMTPGEHVWFIGDSEVDLECALNWGCTSVLYGESAKDHPDYSPTHFRGFPYHAHVHTHAQTLDLLAQASKSSSRP